MSIFITNLEAHLVEEGDEDKIWEIDKPLVYRSDLLLDCIEVPPGFQTDFASVPRWPVAYWLFGGRSHREAVIHDFLFRKDSKPLVTFSQANSVFLEAMTVRKKSFYIRYPMYWAVSLGSHSAFHKREVFERLTK